MYTIDAGFCEDFSLHVLFLLKKKKLSVFEAEALDKFSSNNINQFFDLCISLIYLVFCLSSHMECSSLSFPLYFLFYLLFSFF